MYVSLISLIVYNRIEGVSDPHNNDLWCLTVTTIALLIRQSTIAIRHGTTPYHIHNQWFQERVLMEPSQEFIYKAWGKVTDRIVQKEIRSQMIILGTNS